MVNQMLNCIYPIPSKIEVSRQQAALWDSAGIVKRDHWLVVGHGAAVHLSQFQLLEAIAIDEPSAFDCR
jgi:hypothetical protein